MEINATTSTASAAAIAEDKDAIDSDFDTFIKMLTAQMENQDPLNPLDSQDFATQLATFSGVEQQVKTNELLAALGTEMQLSGLGEMAGWVGMEARISASATYTGTPIELVPNPPAFADSAELVVYDAAGTEIQRQSVSVSDDPVFWNGVSDEGEAFENGQYTFTIEAKSNGEVIDVHVPDIFARVDEVRLVDGASVVVLNGGAIYPASAVSGLR